MILSQPKLNCSECNRKSKKAGGKLPPPRECEKCDYKIYSEKVTKSQIKAWNFWCEYKPDKELYRDLVTLELTEGEAFELFKNYQIIENVVARVKEVYLDAK